MSKPWPVEFKWRQFEPQLILMAVGWYLRFSLSYRDVEELCRNGACCNTAPRTVSSRLLHSLETTAPPTNREEEAAKAKARAAERFGIEPCARPRGTRYRMTGVKPARHRAGTGRIMAV